MKFENIELFTKSGNYEVNVRLSHIEKTLEEFEEDYGLELNPDFQRGHVWTEEQQIAYVEFFIRGGKTARTIYFNCSNFNSTTEIPGHMVCVDGLQRLTAIRKFMSNKLKVFGYYLNDFEDKDVFLRRNEGIRFNINDLKTKKEVLKWYLDFNTGGTVHSKDEILKVKNMMNELK